MKTMLFTRAQRESSVGTKETSTSSSATSCELSVLCRPCLKRESGGGGGTNECGSGSSASTPCAYATQALAQPTDRSSAACFVGSSKGSSNSASVQSASRHMLQTSTALCDAGAGVPSPPGRTGAGNFSTSSERTAQSFKRWARSRAHDAATVSQSAVAAAATPALPAPLSSRTSASAAAWRRPSAVVLSRPSAGT